MTRIEKLFCNILPKTIQKEQIQIQLQLQHQQHKQTHRCVTLQMMKRSMKRARAAEFERIVSLESIIRIIALEL